ncbi:MAG TPA: hypothetical protein VJ824_06200 [Bacillota bacterium]|nr:hypothetical protein [Bacillota bacterium]
MHKQTLGIDIDGTLSEYFSFLPYLNQLLNTQVTPEQLIQYDLHEIFGMEYEAFCSLFDEHSLPIYRDSIPRKCAQKELGWIDQNYHVVYITARLQEFRDITHQWLLTHGFPDRPIICTGSHDKSKAIQDNQVSIMVEDRLENAVEIWNQLKVPVFLLDTPYNQGILPDGIIRVKDWHEIKGKMISND